MREKKIHFVGVCGTAMGSVAAALVERGYRVTGSDAGIYPPMSTFLETSGVEMHEGFRAENIPEDVDVVVIGNAMSRGNPEVEEVLNRRLRYVSLPEIIKEHFLRRRRNVVVTGTHGKTTVTSMMAWILEACGKDPSFMIGGIPRNLGKGARFTDSEFVVLEGDEYDTAFFDKRSKFLHYLPEVVIVNNIEFDHADIFSSLDEIKLSFERLMRVVPSQGRVFVNGDDPNCLDVVEGCLAEVVRVGTGSDCDVRLEDVEYAPGESRFALDGEKFLLRMDGEFNVRNAAMAVCAARFLGLGSDEIRAALEGFEGIARRQEVRGEVHGIAVVDDFGHHPTAMRHGIAAIRQRFPGRRLWAVFEPRSNTTKRKIFQDALPEALSLADGVVVASVAQPEKIPEGDRLDVDAVVDKVKRGGRPAYHGADSGAIVDYLKTEAKTGDVIVIFSNGGFEGIHEKLLAAF